jgi:hypothetical protein
MHTLALEILTPFAFVIHHQTPVTTQGFDIGIILVHF